MSPGPHPADSVSRLLAILASVPPLAKRDDEAPPRERHPPFPVSETFVDAATIAYVVTGVPSDDSQLLLVPCPDTLAARNLPSRYQLLLWTGRWAILRPRSHHPGETDAELRPRLARAFYDYGHTALGHWHRVACAQAAARDRAEAELRRLRPAAEWHRQQAEALSRRARELEDRAARLEQQTLRLAEERDAAVREAEDRVRAVLSSTSWRVTKPLRYLGYLARRLRGAVRGLRRSR